MVMGTSAANKLGFELSGPTGTRRHRRHQLPTERISSSSPSRRPSRQLVGSDHNHDAVLGHGIACGIEHSGHQVRNQGFNGIVAASMIQSGAGTANIRKPTGNARIRNIGHPAEIRTQPAITGSTQSVSTASTPCVLTRTSVRAQRTASSNPPQVRALPEQPSASSRDRHTKKTDAAMIKGPTSAGSARAPRPASNVGIYATRNDPIRRPGQSIACNTDDFFCCKVVKYVIVCPTKYTLTS